MTQLRSLPSKAICTEVLKLLYRLKLKDRQTVYKIDACSCSICEREGERGSSQRKAYGVRIEREGRSEKLDGDWGAIGLGEIERGG